MSPLAVLTAIVFGSAVAIAFGLCGVLVIFLLLHGEYNEIGEEIARLPLYCALFVMLSGMAGAALYGLLKTRGWRWYAQAGMWCAVMLTAGFVWWRQS